MSATTDTAIHEIFTQAAGTYDVVFGADAGTFFMDVEQKSNENLPFFGVFDTFRSSTDSYGAIHPIYAIYAFFSPDWADEKKETTEEEVTAAGLLRSFLSSLKPYLTDSHATYQRFAGGAVSGIWAEVTFSPPTDCEGVPIIPPPPAEIVVRPLAVDANGEYIAPAGTAYSPVVVDVPIPTIEELPLIVERNGVVIPPEGIRYIPITVNVPQQIATDVNLLTRTHTLRGLAPWNPTEPIQYIRGWQLTLWGDGMSDYHNQWSASGDVVVGVRESHTSTFVQVVYLEAGNYICGVRYKNGAGGGLRIWGVEPWNVSAAQGQVIFWQLPNSTTWADALVEIKIPRSGIWRFCVGQDSYSAQWFWISRPFLTPAASGVTSYVPAASDIAEGYYDNAPFNE